ncbi:allantoinase [Radiobacillus sp. PE A8.2]|uniref:allantoinase n=1 Tax=Radiobacillus sp. PE A8.2 TaxID=3380349 RepID=UPI003890934F
MSYDLVIKNGTAILANEAEKVDIAVKDGIITDIAESITASGAKIIDAEGKHIFPGMIDVHVHFNEPGRADWEGISTGSAMMAAGGATAYFDMPLNGVPSTIDKKALKDKTKIAAAKSYTDFGLWGGLVPGNIDQLADLAEAGVVGFKAFISPSGNQEFEAVDDQTLFNGMKKIAELGKILALHAESALIVTEMQREMEAQGLKSAESYTASRPIAAEVEAVQRALHYGEVTGCALHFVHISSERAVKLITEAKQRGQDVTVETCPHYLMFNDNDLSEIGPAAKCAPPLRAQSEQQKLIELIKEGQFDMVASDHSPSPWELKVTEDNNMFKAWGGISGGQFSLLSMVELALENDIPLWKIARLTALQPAQRFGLYPQKGEIKVGCDADFAIINLNAGFKVTEEDLFSKHKHSLYVNHTFPCSIDTTILGGKIVYQNMQIIESPTGKWLKN